MITTHASSLSERPLLLLLGTKVSIRENALLADTVSYKNLEQMVGNLIKLVHALDVGANDCLFILENSDCAIHFHIVQIASNASKREWMQTYS